MIILERSISVRNKAGEKTIGENHVGRRGRGEKRRKKIIGRLIAQKKMIYGKVR